jgi:hypothetical protein
VSEAERQRVIKEQFDQSQAQSRPYFEQLQQMINEGLAADKKRHATKGADAMIRAGLHGLSAGKPGMQGFFEGAIKGMDYYDKAQELEAAANAKSRQAQMDLLKARMADEKGDREAAQRYFDSYQKNLRDKAVYEMQRDNAMVQASAGAVNIEGKRDRAILAQQGLLEKNQHANDIKLLQLELANARAAAANASAAARAEERRMPTLETQLRLQEHIDRRFGVPGGPPTQHAISLLPKEMQSLIKNGTIKPNDPRVWNQLAPIIMGKQNSLLQGSRTPGAGTFASDAERRLGLN